MKIIIINNYRIRRFYDIEIYIQSLMAKSCFTVWYTNLSVA
jgi:hypothetical protein